MSSQRTKIIFANERENDFFESNLTLLGGSRFNDWLPLSATAVFALGWLIGFSIARSTWPILKQILAGLLFLVLLIGLAYMFDSWLGANSFSVFRELVRTCTILCMFGFVAGNPIGVFQKMKTG